MIKEWLMVVMLASSPTNPDVFIFEQPVFDNPQTCIEWVNTYPMYWIPVVQNAYPESELHNVVCVEHDKLKELVPTWPGLKEERIETETEPYYVPEKNINGHYEV
tara:strand:- start:243 stop:557 length:315 start_codon:yes stop_codon:yes gene_type:complete